MPYMFDSWRSFWKLTDCNKSAKAFLSPVSHSFLTYSGAARSLRLGCGLVILSILALAALLRLNCRGKMDDNDDNGRDKISKPEVFDKPNWKTYIVCLSTCGGNCETSDLSMYRAYTMLDSKLQTRLPKSHPLWKLPSRRCGVTNRCSGNHRISATLKSSFSSRYHRFLRGHGWNLAVSADRPIILQGNGNSMILHWIVIDFMPSRHRFYSRCPQGQSILLKRCIVRLNGFEWPIKGFECQNFSKVDLEGVLKEHHRFWYTLRKMWLPRYTLRLRQPYSEVCTGKVSMSAISAEGGSAWERQIPQKREKICVPAIYTKSKEKTTFRIKIVDFLRSELVPQPLHVVNRAPDDFLVDSSKLEMYLRQWNQQCSWSISGFIFFDCRLIVLKLFEDSFFFFFQKRISIINMLDAIP